MLSFNEETHSKDFDLRGKLFSHQLVADVGPLVGDVVDQGHELLCHFLLLAGLGLRDGGQRARKQHDAEKLQPLRFGEVS